MRFNLFNQGDNEKEMSGGAMFGYALIGFIAIVVIMFIIFAATKLVGNKNSKEKVETQVETQVESEEQANTADTTEESI